LLGLSKGPTNSERAGGPGGQLLPVHWNIKGKTHLQNWRTGRRFDSQTMPKGGATGSYTMRRTWRAASQNIKAISKAGKTMPAYFITHTMPAHYDNEQRRAHWRKFIDNLRKQGCETYVWITERHGGAGACDGLIHHHAIALFRSVWYYGRRVRRWSVIYSGSTNGLQIERVKRSASAYLAPYLQKSMPAPTQCPLLPKQTGGDDLDVLPFRWWGSRGVPKGGLVWLERDAGEWNAFRTPWYDRQSIWVSGAIAADWAASLILAAMTSVPLGLRGAGAPRPG